MGFAIRFDFAAENMGLTLLIKALFQKADKKKIKKNAHRPSRAAFRPASASGLPWEFLVRSFDAAYHFLMPTVYSATINQRTSRLNLLPAPATMTRILCVCALRLPG